MHCVLEGVVKKLLNLWLSAVGELYYIKRYTDIINARLLSIKPPNTITRTPRSVDQASRWKGIIIVLCFTSLMQLCKCLQHLNTGHGFYSIPFLCCKEYCHHLTMGTWSFWFAPCIFCLVTVLLQLTFHLLRI